MIHKLALLIKNRKIIWQNFREKLSLISLKEILSLVKYILVPKEVSEKLEDIDFLRLYAEGYRVLLLDIDNTLMTYRQRALSLQKIHFLERVKSIGFEIYLVSNNINMNRAKRVAKDLKVKGVYFSLKPLVFGVRELAEKNMLDLSKAVVVGDQILTDVIMGNWLRCYTVLVDPLDKKLSFLKTLQREIELFLVRSFHL
ncbi:hypothetical protein HOC37_05095 [bacterium]|jgi:uncharacterized protein|nr:hypothetical protein [bacterium]MBT3581247.1 hypothetical protein [bacterium]MBT4552338.1 hypothetical protein [bacterium]MBT5988970.1 hypothetical protein [bacterium]MBT7088390.1 hypothetical protein [bacterium]